MGGLSQDNLIKIVINMNNYVRTSSVANPSKKKCTGIGFLATKAGMTTWLMPTGQAMPCTVLIIEEGNIVTQLNKDDDGILKSLQIGYKIAKEKTLSKPELGH